MAPNIPQMEAVSHRCAVHSMCHYQAWPFQSLHAAQQLSLFLADCLQLCTPYSLCQGCELSGKGDQVNSVHSRS